MKNKVVLIVVMLKILVLGLHPNANALGERLITKKLDFANIQNENQSDSLTVLDIDVIISKTEEQYLGMIAMNNDSTLYPRSSNADASLRLVASWDWTSGFFPGSLWFLHEYTQNENWMQYASQWTAGIENQKTNTGTHDLGFMLGCSFGNGYRLTDNKNYKDILLTAANSLVSRYDGEVECIRSWDFGSWEFPVIIDNMMNLELLFLASKLSSDQKYYNIAVDHALTTRKNHIREDNSTWHVVDYNVAFGEVKGKYTHQGYSDSSSWARGQAWGIYGYTVCYRETGDPRFLETAEDLALFVINHKRLPDDLIPYWDYDDPAIPNAPRDASAAAITCSALLELSSYSEQYADTFWNFAKTLLYNLSSSDYRANPGSNNNFILMHSTGNKPGGSEIDVPINYADYYYLEALLRYRKLINNPPVPELNADTKTGDAPLTVFFDVSQTADPNKDSIVFIWDFGDGNIDSTSIDTISHTFKEPGNYIISVNVTDYWGSLVTATDTIKVQLASGIQEFNLIHILVYPNPVEDKVQLYSQELINKSFIVFIADLSGRKVYQKKILNQQLPTITLDINESNIDSGPYFLCLVNSDMRLTKEIIKK